MEQNILSVSCKHSHVHEHERERESEGGGPKPDLALSVCILAKGTNNPLDLWRRKGGERVPQEVRRGERYTQKIQQFRISGKRH